MVLKPDVEMDLQTKSESAIEMETNAMRMLVLDRAPSLQSWQCAKQTASARWPAAQAQRSFAAEARHST